jgi:hypothetical protein
MIAQLETFTKRPQFETRRKEWTDTIHQNLRDMIYPAVYGLQKEDITYADDMPDDIAKYLDFNCGIDRTLHVRFPNMKAPIDFAVQERFRNVTYQQYQDITITEWTGDNKPGELYKLSRVKLFTYGYYNQSENHLVEVIVLNCPKMLDFILSGKLKMKERINNGYRPFLCYDFSELHRCGLVLLHLREINGKLVKVKVQPNG